MRRATVLATVVLVMGALAAPAMAVAPDDVPDEGAADITRIAGDTRYHTAADTAVRTFPDGADTVLVATGEKFPDALAASFLAGAGGEVSAPIVLVRPHEVPSPTAAALDQLEPTNLIVLGRENAVNEDTYDQLAEIVGEDNISRIGGDTRIETAAMIAAEGGNVGTMADQSGDTDEQLKTAIVARADEFPDALASGPLALEGRHPIVLTHTDDLPQATADVLTDADLGIEQVIITGGPVAVSQDVEDAIAGLDSIVNVSRVAGSIRTETAVELAELTRATLGWDATDIALARGDNFPDALTLAPRAAQLNASLFLSRNPETIEGHTFAGIQALCGEVQDLLITGGPIAISAEAEGEAKLATICADHVFPIDADQETADGKAGAEGTGWVTIVDDTICTVYDVKGLDGLATDSHIHEAVEGSDGDVVLNLGVPNAEGFLATCDANASLAAEIEADPAAYYVNIHTSDFAAGAARGQLDGTEDNRTALEGETEVEGPADGPGTGFVDAPSAGAGTVDLFFGEGELCYELSVSGLASPVDPSIAGGFHIHEGAFDANGPVVVALPQSQSSTDYTAFDCVEVAQSLLDEIAADPQDYYFNLHTVDGADPDTPLNGALRGQLGANAEFHVYGDAEVNDDTEAEPVFGQGVEGLRGNAALTTGADAGTLCLSLEFPGDGLADDNQIADPDDAGAIEGGVHIHTGRVDENGPILISFPGLEGTEGGLICSEGNAPTDVQAVLTAPSAHYLNVHTELNPGGAARGQVGADHATELTGAAEVGDDAGDLTASGSAKVYQASAANPDVVCGEFHVEGADALTAAHIHEAPAGENGGVVVTIGDYGDAGVEAPGADITHDFGCQTDVDPTTAGEIFTTPADYYVNVHSETFINGAVRGQLG